ncbi:carbonic anhydrase family protein [Candidatus Albibeggiatoa sp. nov. BB20]|uniref:carbonic anhydrase n=1 Tax=Candidatus Albibeggiatoa sp. nov. BB20 TaxID=3162723 RepID=UPI0033657191
MRKILSFFAVSFLFFSSLAHASPEQWAYSGATGPEHWADVNPSYHSCREGKNQSPVNLTNFVEADLPVLTFQYQTQAKEMLHNGHTIRINMAEGSQLGVDGLTLSVKQFHFHSPSENQINGESFPMEAHIVHGDGKGNFAVIGVMFREGEANPTLESLWANMPTHSGEYRGLETVDLSSLLPENRDYYRFTGSLTTPPCFEGLRWLVMKNPITASKAQIEQFQKVMGHANNRPIQPINARVVLQ